MYYSSLEMYVIAIINNLKLCQMIFYVYKYGIKIVQNKQKDKIHLTNVSNGNICF